MTERHVAEGGRHIKRQHEIIAELSCNGHDTQRAREQLGLFEELQTSHTADRDRLAKNWPRGAPDCRCNAMIRATGEREGTASV